MAIPSPNPKKPLGTPVWLFPWRRGESAFFSTFLAAVFVSGLASIAYPSISVKITTPQQIIPRKASLIYLTNTSEGRTLALKAQEGGPFPSRFRPSQWQGMAQLEGEIALRTRLPREVYSTQLRPVPEAGLATLGAPPLAREMVFPESRAPATLPEVAQRVKMIPQLFPLAGIKAEEIPSPLPTYVGAAEGAWRFLIQIEASGRVKECISLAKGGDPGAVDLQKWLRGVSFSTSPGRWISVGVRFINQAENASEN